jgi:hypothetical protein
MTPETEDFERLVVIATYSSIAQARIAASTLESFGIEAEVEMETSYSSALGGVKLLVPGDESIWARHYLQKTAHPIDDAEWLDSEDDPCPTCGSDRVYPIERRRKIGTVVLFSVISIPMTILGILFQPLRDLLSSNSECKACGNRW